MTSPEERGEPNNAEPVSKDDLDSWAETAYLLRSPRNAERLLAAQQRADAGQYEERELAEP